MKKLRVLMVDDNIELVGMVKEYFKNHASIEVVMEAHDGYEAIEYAKNKKNLIEKLVDIATNEEEV